MSLVAILGCAKFSGRFFLPTCSLSSQRRSPCSSAHSAAQLSTCRGVTGGCCSRRVLAVCGLSDGLVSFSCFPGSERSCLTLRVPARETRDRMIGGSGRVFHRRCRHCGCGLDTVLDAGVLVAPLFVSLSVNRCLSSHKCGRRYLLQQQER